jgi:cell division protein FtsB
VARSSASEAATASRVWFRRLAWGAGVTFVVWYAAQGGEYGTTDLLAQREANAVLQADLEALRDTVATLEAALTRATSDDWALERVAREKYGMVKGEKELLYRLERTAPPAP